MAEKGEADRQTDRVRKVRAISGERGGGRSGGHGEGWRSDMATGGGVAWRWVEE